MRDLKGYFYQRMNFRLIGVLGLLSTSLLTANAAPVNHPKLSSALQQMLSSERRVNVIVQYSQIPTEKEHSTFVALGGSVRGRYRQLKFGSYTIPANRLT